MSVGHLLLTMVSAGAACFGDLMSYCCIFKQTCRHSAAERRASTRILHLTLFLALVLISAQVFLTLLASSSTVLCHVFLSLPLPRLPWGFHSRACLAMSSDGFCSLWPSHPHLCFLICKSILGCFVRFHSSLSDCCIARAILDSLIGIWFVVCHFKNHTKFRANLPRIFYFTIKVTNWCDFCDISLFTFPCYPYMFRAFTSPSSGVSSAAVYVLPLGSCSALLFVCVRLLCGLVRCDEYTVVTTSNQSTEQTHANNKAVHEPSGST